MTLVTLWCQRVTLRTISAIPMDEGTKTIESPEANCYGDEPSEGEPRGKPPNEPLLCPFSTNVTPIIIHAVAMDIT